MGIGVGDGSHSFALKLEICFWVSLDFGFREMGNEEKHVSDGHEVGSSQGTVAIPVRKVFMFLIFLYFFWVLSPIAFLNQFAFRSHSISFTFFKPLFFILYFFHSPAS